MTRHVSTLQHFYVNASPFFRAESLQGIPFTVKDLTLINQSDIGWQALAYLPPSLESQILLNCPNVTQGKPIGVEFPSKLRSLTISYNGADTAFFEKLPQSLRSLTLHGAQGLTKESLSKLKPGVQSLRLEHCNATGPHIFNSTPETLQRVEVVYSTGINAEDLNRVSIRGGTTLFSESGEYL